MRHITCVAVLALAGATVAGAESGDNGRNNVLFSQSDKVVAFNFANGQGSQVGTVSGKINGTSIVNFQFFPPDLTGAFNFSNTVVITDLDGDQIKFLNNGKGRFIPPIDGTVFAIGGPLTGTYEVVSGTGKFSSWKARKYPYRAVASNPVGNLGTVYVEVYSNPVN